MEYKVMIVDGEDTVRRQIAETFPWEKWEYRICALCSNGQEAMEQIDKASPDVVLSNIRMPVMDGIDLMQWLHQNRPGIKVVILSCFSDFNHLNLAIKSQVTDYLLKPVDQGAFQEVFLNLHNKIDAERKRTQDIQQSVELHFEQWLKNLARGTASREDTLRFENKAAQRGINLHNCYLAAIYPDGRAGEDAESCQQFRQEVQSLLNGLQLPVGCYCLTGEEGQIGAVFSAPGKELPKDQVEAAAEILQQQVKSSLKNTVTLGISPHVGAMNQLPEAWRDALYCMRQSLLKGSEGRMFYEDMVLSCTSRIPYFSPEVMEGYLLDGDYDAMEGEIFRVFESFGEGQMLEYRVIDRLVLSLLFTVDLWALRYDVHMDEVLQGLGSCFEDIHRCDTLTKKRDYLCAVLFAVQLELKKQRSQSRKGASLAYQVRELIEREYDRSDMSLDYIALKLKKHPSYVSKIFKKELSCNFNDYLNKLRIEKAEQLLMHPENKIYEIAQACGYVDTSHFNRVFRKYKGVSPSEYREAGARKDG